MKKLLILTLSGMLSNIPRIKTYPSQNFFLISGPCAVESKALLQEVAAEMKEMSQALEIPYIFKGSYKKANRSRLDSFTGIGDEKALEFLKETAEEFELPVITDVHSIAEVKMAANYVDVLQIPAFLCRQTELIVAAAKTGKTVIIKKGQFMSPGSMKFAIEKVTASGNPNVGIIERGSTFGPQDLVVDFRGIPQMRSFEVPVILDCTHSLQRPNQSSGVTGGMPELIETIAKAGVACGVDGLFLETHPQPSIAKSDGKNMLPLSEMKSLLEKLVKIRRAIAP